MIDLISMFLDESLFKIDLERSFIHERKRPKTEAPTSRERHEQRKKETDQCKEKRQQG